MERPETSSLVQTMVEARKRARLTQEELADLAGLSRRPVYHLERGKGTLTLDSLIRLADVLGLEIVARPRRGNE